MPPPDPENASRVLSFTDHLEELRGRLIICVAFFFLTFLISLWFAPAVVEWLIQPLVHVKVPETDRMLVLRVSEDGAVRFAGTTPSDSSLTADQITTASTTAPIAASRLTTETLTGLSADRIRIELPFGHPAIVTGAGGKSSSQLFYLSPMEPLMLLIKGALLSSAAVSIPMTIYQLWLFIAPGLLRRERKVVRGLLFSSLLLFPTGALFAYFVAHVALQFLLSFETQIPGLSANIVATNYVGFIMGLMLIFGLVFEFPLVLLLLARLGVIDSEFLVRKRRVAIVIMAIVAAVGTPSPDPFSMIAMFIPLLALYEGSIWAIRITERAETAAAELKLRQDSL